MATRSLLALPVLLLLLPAAAEPQEPEKQQYRWVDLESRITNSKVAFMLPDGTQVKGRVLAVVAEGLRMNVTETSDPSAQSKGQHLIPAQSLSVIRVMESSKKWRVICTIAAPFAAVAAYAGAAGGLPDSSESGNGSVSAVVLGSLAGGYFLGRALDKKATEIEIIRD